MERVCRYCKRDDVIKRCSRCKIAYYCNRECQKNDYPTHKVVCRDVKEEVPAYVDRQRYIEMALVDPQVAMSLTVTYQHGIQDHLRIYPDYRVVILIYPSTQSLIRVLQHTPLDYDVPRIEYQTAAEYNASVDNGMHLTERFSYQHDLNTDVVYGFATFFPVIAMGVGDKDQFYLYKVVRVTNP